MPISSIASPPTLQHQCVNFAMMFIVAFAEIALAYFPLFFGVSPKLLITIVFLIAIYDEEQNHFINLIGVGLIYDMMQSAPLGYTSGAMILVNLFGILSRHRLKNVQQSLIWLEYAALMVTVMLYTWICIVLINQGFPAVMPLVFQYSVTVLLFPIMIGIYKLELSLMELIRRLK